MPFNFQTTTFNAKMQYNRPCKFSRPWYNLRRGYLRTIARKSKIEITVTIVITG